MNRGRIDLMAVVTAAVDIAAAINLFAGMHRGQAVEIGFHAFRQAVIGGVHAGEQGVAADLGHLPEMQDAAHRWLVLAGDIGVPAFTGHMLGVFIGVNH